jgi:HK97 family phage portal protein
MKLLPWLTRAARNTEQRDMLETQGSGGLSNLSAIWNFLDGGQRPNESGQLVNDVTATSIATVYTCTRIIADAVASLPCLVYKTSPTGKQLDVDSALLHLLSVESNPETSAYSFMHTAMVHLQLRGNAYISIQRAASGDVVALWGLSPAKTKPVRLMNGDLAYSTSDGESGSNTRMIKAADMIHLTLFSYDGIQGESPIGMLRELLGLSLAQQAYSARLIRNNSIPSVAISIEGTLKPEDKTKAKADWHAIQAGGAQGSVAILDNGMKIERLGLSAVDSELLASRAFSRSEIAAAFKVPGHMVGDNSRMSGTTAEQSSLTFVQDTLGPLIKRIEVEFKRKLLPPAPNGKPSSAVIMFDLRARLRGDFQSTMTAFGTGRQWGFYSTNDVRRELGEDTIGPEGDIYLQPVNMVDAGRPQSQPQSQQIVNPVVDTVPDQPVRTAHYLGLMRDAVGRLTARSTNQRDLATVGRIFEPLVSSIAELSATNAKRSMNATEGNWEPTKAIADYLVKLTERSASWGTDLDLVAATELQKLVKALHLAAHRGMAEQQALKGLESA